MAHEYAGSGMTAYDPDAFDPWPDEGNDASKAPDKAWWYVMEKGNRLGAMELYPDEAVPGARVDDPCHPGLFVTVIEPALDMAEVMCFLPGGVLTDH